MKNKILYSIATLLIFTFAFVIYASTGSSKVPVYASGDSCCAMKDCCKDGVCKMGGECCKNHESCQMNKKDGKEVSAMHNHDGKAECCKDRKCSMNSECCKDGVCKMGCCKDGKCDMKAHKKDGESTAKKGDCCGGDSCQMKHKKDN